MSYDYRIECEGLVAAARKVREDGESAAKEFRAKAVKVKADAEKAARECEAKAAHIERLCNKGGPPKSFRYQNLQPARTAPPRRASHGDQDMIRKGLV